MHLKRQMLLKVHIFMYETARNAFSDIVSSVLIRPHLQAIYFIFGFFSMFTERNLFFYLLCIYDADQRNKIHKL